MNKKIFGIFVLMLLIVTSISVVGNGLISTLLYFDVGVGDIDKFLVDAIIRVHSFDFSEDSGDVITANSYPNFDDVPALDNVRNTDVGYPNLHCHDNRYTTSQYVIHSQAMENSNSDKIWENHQNSKKGYPC